MRVSPEEKASAEVVINKLTELGMMIRAFPNRDELLNEEGLIRADFYNKTMGELDVKFHEFFKAYHSTLDECNGRLISPEGQNEYAIHQLMTEAGFSVRAGERDRFGWLSGIIRSRHYNFQLVYG